MWCTYSGRSSSQPHPVMPLCVAVLLWWSMCVVCAGTREGLVCSVLFGGYGIMWTKMVVSFLWRTYSG